MSDRPDRTVDEWMTTAVTALPAGWRNVYTMEQGKLLVLPCPALLLQELRATDQVWDLPAGDPRGRIRSETTTHQPPYETRVVFAARSDLGSAWLEPADLASNYIATAAPDEDPATLVAE